MDEVFFRALRNVCNAENGIVDWVGRTRGRVAVGRHRELSQHTPSWAQWAPTLEPDGARAERKTMKRIRESAAAGKQSSTDAVPNFGKRRVTSNVHLNIRDKGN